MAIETGARPGPPGEGRSAERSPAQRVEPPARSRRDTLLAALRSPGVLRILLPVVLVAVAGSLRLHRLGVPERCYFDETYYYYDARDLVRVGVEDGFVVHPPVGKWLIAAGLAAFGVDPGSPADQVPEEPQGCDAEGPALAREAAESFARRVAAAVAGTLTVLVTYLVGLRLFRRRGIAALAALLLAVDGLAFTMSRIAMLDVFLGLFVLLGFWFLLLDRDQQWEGAEPLPAGTGDAPVLPRRPHGWRWAAGVAFGLALATKWSALLAIGSAGLFVLVSELAWRRRLTGRLLVKPWRIVASGLLTLVAVPAVVYVASYAGWFANFPETDEATDRCGEGVECALPAPELASAWLHEQRQIADFHRGLEAEHPYRAPATTWPTLSRPVAYYYEGCDAEQQAAGECSVAPGNVAEILGIGNPLVWWMALLAYAVLAWFAVKQRDWRAWAIAVFLLGQYLPWLFATRPVFLFYALPAVPLVCLAVAYVGWRCLDARTLRWVPTAVATVAVVGFLFWYPVLAGVEISKQAWNLRMWMSSWI